MYTHPYLPFDSAPAAGSGPGSSRRAPATHPSARPALRHRRAPPVAGQLKSRSKCRVSNDQEGVFPQGSPHVGGLLHATFPHSSESPVDFIHREKLGSILSHCAAVCGDLGVQRLRHPVQGDAPVGFEHELLLEPELLLKALQVGQEVDDLADRCGESPAYGPSARSKPGRMSPGSRSSRFRTSVFRYRSSSRRRKPPRSLWMK